MQLAQDFRNFDFQSPWEGAEYVLPGDEKGTMPKAAEVKTTEAPKQTGAGQPHPGNKAEDKPKDPDAVPGKGGGQNQ